MPLNKPVIQQHLRDFNFRQLFIEELGWDNPPAATAVMVDGQRYALTAIAHKRGMVAYQCPAPEGARIPEYALRRKIEQQVTKSAHEHLIIFTDAAQTTQIWQWVKREPGKPAACREHTYHRSQSGEALIQKLQTIAFSFDEEETLTLVDVASRTRKGFDVEHVTKRFYDQFKKEHASFLKFVKGIDDAADCEWYASVMLNRLMFVYFVQRKGFLDGDQDYLRNRLKRCQQEKGKDKFYSFYRYFLLRLFHEGLGGKARPKELQDLLGRIPYLNGGFFEKHVIEQRWEKIQIPDRAFERIFDYFDQYQWHLDERPLRADNEINPDVLGFIFEKYINQKQMGAYYTKEDITGYMSRNTIIPFLFDAARKEHKAAFEGDNAVWKLLQADPDRYIYPAIKHGIKINIHTGEKLAEPLPLPPDIAAGINPPGLHDPVREVKNLDDIPTIRLRRCWNKPAPPEYALPTEIWREVVARRQRYDELHGKLASGQVRDINDLITLNLDIVQFAQDVIRNCDSPELLRAFWHALEKLSVLDPTVGSGAFLFAALNILKPLYEACLERMEAFVGDLDRSGEKHRPEKFSDFRAVLERVEAHPNSDYFILKSIILNNLFGVDIMEEATEICKLRLFLKLAAQVEPDPTKDNFGIEPLPDIDFNIRAGNTLVGYATADEVRRAFKEEAGGQGKLLLGESSSAYKRFEENVELADRAFRQFREMQTERGMDSSQFASAKVTLRRQMKALEDELNRYLASDFGAKVSDKEAYSKWLATHLPFHWFIEFYGIVSAGGFDLIIGNPPYVEDKKVEGYHAVGFETQDCGNLYAYATERSLTLLKTTGRIGVILPTASISLAGTGTLRTVLTKHASPMWHSSFGFRPAKLFEGVNLRLTILIAQKSKASDPEMLSCRYMLWSYEERSNLFQRLQFFRSARAPDGRFLKIDSPVALSIFRKVTSQKTRVDSLIARSRGFKLSYHRSPLYWIRAMDFEPYFKSATKERSVHHFRDLYFQDEERGRLVGALLNSSLFFFWFVAVGNCRNLTNEDVLEMPLGNVSPANSKRLAVLFAKLMKDYVKNSEITTRYNCEYQTFYPSKSKAILDEVDSSLAGHYGFTDEELDFIINYDTKYRLRLEEGEEDE